MNYIDEFLYEVKRDEIGKVSDIKEWLEDNEVHPKSWTQLLRCTFLWKKKQKKQRQYSVEFKLCAILDKLENGLNYFETVRKHWNLSTTAEANKYANRLKLWERKYLEGGIQGLMEERRGRACGPGKGRPRKKPRSQEEENPLIAENRRLKMEIEYLKKLNALVLANERARKNKRK